MASSVLVVPKAGENSNLGNISLQLSLLFEAASKGLLLFFFFSLIAAMMLSYRAWLRVGPQHVNEWSIASKAGMRVDSVFRLLLVLSFFLVIFSIVFLFTCMLNVLVCFPLHFPVSVYV